MTVYPRPSSTVSKAQLPNFVQQSSVIVVGFFRTVMSNRYTGKYRVTMFVSLSDLFFLGRGFRTVRISRQDHIQQRSNGSIWSSLSDSRTTCWAGKSKRGTGSPTGATLGCKPFFQTRTAECMKTIEEGEGLVKEFCTNLRGKY